MTVLQILEIPRKAILVLSYFSAVSGLAILLKQYPTTGVFVKRITPIQSKIILRDVYQIQRYKYTI